MDPATVLKTGSEAVSLGAALVKLIKENRGKPAGKLSELLASLRIEALRISGQLENKLEILLEKFGELGLDPERSLDSQIEDLSWYSWIRRSQLKTYRDDFHSVCRQFTAFIDDATAILLCESGHMQAQGIKTEMFAEAHRKKRELDEVLMAKDRTIGGMLQKILKEARTVTTDLRSA